MTGSEVQIARRRAGNAWHGDLGLLLLECTPAAPSATGANAGSTERKSAPGYKGFVIHAAPDVTLAQEVARRDITINSIASYAVLTLDGGTFGTIFSEKQAFQPDLTLLPCGECSCAFVFQPSAINLIAPHLRSAHISRNVPR